MPFKRFIPKTHNTHDNSSPRNDAGAAVRALSQIPIFLVSSFMGGPLDRFLLLQLYIASGGQPIYSWEHEIPTFAPTENTSIELGRTIAADAQIWLPRNQAPYLLVGYSAGCPIITQAAQELVRDNQSCFLAHIDGPTALCSKERFKHIDDTLFGDLIRIVNSAAQASGLTPIDPQTIKLSDVICSNIDTLSPDDTSHRRGRLIVNIVERLACLIVADLANSENFTFAGLIRQAQQGLFNLATYEGDPSQEKAQLRGGYAALITEQTAGKYGQTNGGWEAYQTELFPFKLFPSSHLQSADHLSLMSNGSATLVAKQTIAYFKEQCVLTDENELRYYQLQLQLHDLWANANDFLMRIAAGSVEQKTFVQSLVTHLQALEIAGSTSYTAAEAAAVATATSGPATETESSERVTSKSPSPTDDHPESASRSRNDSNGPLPAPANGGYPLMDDHSGYGERHVAPMTMSMPALPTMQFAPPGQAPHAALFSALAAYQRPTRNEERLAFDSPARNESPALDSRSPNP